MDCRELLALVFLLLRDLVLPALLLLLFVVLLVVLPRLVLVLRRLLPLVVPRHLVLVLRRLLPLVVVVVAVDVPLRCQVSFSYFFIGLSPPWFVQPPRWRLCRRCCRRQTSHLRSSTLIGRGQASILALVHNARHAIGGRARGGEGAERESGRGVQAAKLGPPFEKYRVFVFVTVYGAASFFLS